MTSKTFEIRDRMTFIPVLAVQLGPGGEADRYLLARSGYGCGPAEQAEYVLLVQINGGHGAAMSDPNEWGGRTMPVAHQYIKENFDSLASGAVVDVEFILGEKTLPSTSEASELALKQALRIS